MQVLLFYVEHYGTLVYTKYDELAVLVVLQFCFVKKKVPGDFSSSATYENSSFQCSLVVYQNPLTMQLP